MLSVTFDDREHSVRSAFAKRIEGRTDVQMECRRLEMGDVLIQNIIPDGTTRQGPMIVVERKQVNDLMSSLFDGRLAEQCSRMRQYQIEQTTGDVWIVVVVEGLANADLFRAQNPDAKFRHSQGRTCTYDPVAFVKTYLQLAMDAQPSEYRLVLRTTGEEETAALLLTLHKTIWAGAGGSHQALVRNMPRKTHSEIFVRHLCCTQGVSVHRAEQIRQRYASLVELHLQLEKDPSVVIQSLTQAIGSQRVAHRLCADIGHAVEVPIKPKKREASEIAGKPKHRKQKKRDHVHSMSPSSSPSSLNVGTSG